MAMAGWSLPSVAITTAGVDSVATPDSPSEAEKLTVTASAFHPSAPGGGSATAVTTGAARSIRTSRRRGASTFPGGSTTWTAAWAPARARSRRAPPRRP